MSSEARRRTDENGGVPAPTALKIPDGLPNSRVVGKLSGIFLPADHQGEQGQNRSQCRKFPKSPGFLAKPYAEKNLLTTHRGYAPWSLTCSPLRWSLEATPVLFLPPYCRRKKKKCRRSSTSLLF